MMRWVPLLNVLRSLERVLEITLIGQNTEYVSCEGVQEPMKSIRETSQPQAAPRNLIQHDSASFPLSQPQRIPSTWHLFQEQPVTHRPQTAFAPSDTVPGNRPFTATKKQVQTH